MPLVRIDAPSAAADQLAALGAAVHDALIEAFAIPADDRFQVLSGASSDRVVYDARYLGVDRDDGIAFVQIFLRTGRDDQQKQHFYRTLAANAAAIGVDQRNLLVVLTENTLADWSFGNGVAQYLENAS